MRLFNRWAGICVVVAISVTTYLVHAAHCGTGPAQPPASAAGGTVLNPFRQDLSGLSTTEAANYWSAWGDYYSNCGPVDMSITCFLKAAQLDPSEAVHHINLANTISVFRQRSSAYFGLDEQAVLKMALLHYRLAARLEPENYEYARLYALTYYSVTPLPASDALAAWKKVMDAAGSDFQRQEACLNLARLCIQSDQLIDAQGWLNRASDETLQVIKHALARRLQEKLQAAQTLGGQTAS